MLSACGGFIRLPGEDAQAQQPIATSKPAPLLIYHVGGTRSTIAWTEPAGVFNYEIRGYGGAAADLVSPSESAVDEGTWKTWTEYERTPGGGHAGEVIKFSVPNLQVGHTSLVGVRYYTTNQADRTNPSEISVLSITPQIHTTSLTGRIAGNNPTFHTDIGNVNGDKYTDVIVGISSDQAGVIFLLLGADTAFGSERELAPSAMFTAGSHMGAHNILGDVDCDGIDDVLLGRPSDDNNKGHVYVIKGSAHFNDVYFYDPVNKADYVFTADANADGSSKGFGLEFDVSSRKSGTQCSDVIVGAPYANRVGGGGGSGAVYSIPAPLGKAAITVDDAYLTAQGEQASDNAGRIVSNVGDLTDGGADETIYVNYRRETGGPPATAYDIKLGLVINGWISTTTYSYRNVPIDVTDFNFGDLASLTEYSYGNTNRYIALPSPRGGVVYVYYGGAPILGNPNLTFTYGDPGFGISVRAGDFNADGHTDIVIGSYTHIYVFHGPSFGGGTVPDEVFNVPGYGMQLFDFNGDGYLDIVAGNPQASPGQWQLTFIY